MINTTKCNVCLFLQKKCCETVRKLCEIWKCYGNWLPDGPNSVRFCLTVWDMARMYPATHPVILLYNKLPCINHFQPPSRPLCQRKPNFKQRFHQIHLVHIVLQLVSHDLITGLQVLWGQNYGIQYPVKNTWDLENWPRFRGCTPTLPVCMNLPSS